MPGDAALEFRLFEDDKAVEFKQVSRLRRWRSPRAAQELPEQAKLKKVVGDGAEGLSHEGLELGNSE